MSDQEHLRCHTPNIPKFIEPEEPWWRQPLVRWGLLAPLPPIDTEKLLRLMDEHIKAHQRSSPLIRSPY